MKWKAPVKGQIKIYGLATYSNEQIFSNNFWQADL